MANAKVVSVRVPLDLLTAIDQRLAAQYHSRQHLQRNPTRSDFILDAISDYVNDTVNNDTVNKKPVAAADLDIEVIRDQILSSLKLGKQAPEYKRTKAAIDQFIAKLRMPETPPENA